MKLFILALFTWFASVQALHFYLTTGEQRCFYEDLQADSLVVGKIDAYEFDNRIGDYFKNERLKVKITVDETFHNDHRVVDQNSNQDSDFVFNSHDAGEHRFCLTPLYTDGLHGKRHRIFFDITTGAASDYVDSKSSKNVDDLTLQIQYLNRKFQEIRMEQENIRDREALFRNQSESTNSRVVWWSIIQLLVLAGTCAYQMRHLKSFFVKQKIM